MPGRGQNLTTALIDQLGDYGLGDIHLVVLSACETAVGDRASDGIEIPGISYFFLKNEVKAVMASLWSVNDASTSLIMQQFYKQLATSKMTKAEALQRVQQQFITGKLTAQDAPSRAATLISKGNSPLRQRSNGDFSHPFYWAPFILIGNSL
ncbi:MAG: CHAT domain-containing protein [Kovacikia sp.]